jgi:hypothetical protein
VLGGLLGEVFGSRIGAPLVSDLRMQDHQPRFISVEDVAARLRADVDTCEVTVGASLTLKPANDLSPHVLFMEPLGLVFGCAGDIGLEVVPIPARPGVEVRRPVAELGECGMEVARHIPRDRGAEEDPLDADAFVHRAWGDRWGGTEEHRPREALCERPLAEQGLLLVNACGLGVRPVDVGIDDRLPRVLKALRQLGIHIRRGERDGTVHDQRRGVFAHPKRVDHGASPGAGMDGKPEGQLAAPC